MALQNVAGVLTGRDLWIACFQYFLIYIYGFGVNKTFLV
jgi:hypothetical protein